MFLTNERSYDTFELKKKNIKNYIGDLIFETSKNLNFLIFFKKGLNITKKNLKKNAFITKISNTLVFFYQTSK